MVLRDVISLKLSPYVSEALHPILVRLKALAGLPPASFGAPVYRLYSLPTFFELIFPRVMRLATAVSVD